MRLSVCGSESESCDRLLWEPMTLGIPSSCFLHLGSVKWPRIGGGWGGGMVGDSVQPLILSSSAPPDLSTHSHSQIRSLIRHPTEPTFGFSGRLNLI